MTSPESTAATDWPQERLIWPHNERQEFATKSPSLEQQYLYRCAKLRWGFFRPQAKAQLSAKFSETSRKAIHELDLTTHQLSLGASNVDAVQFSHRSTDPDHCYPNFGMRSIEPGRSANSAISASANLGREIRILMPSENN